MILSKRFLKATFLILAVLIIQGCAPTGQLGGDWQTYDKEYAEMKGILQEAIYGGGLQIIDEEESKNGTLLTLTVEERQSKMDIEEATVFLRKSEGNKSAVKVENPDYHYTVPDFERTDYKRRIFNRLETALK